MPVIKRPKSSADILKALQAAKSMKNAAPVGHTIPLSASTITWLDTFYPAYELSVRTMEAALAEQTAITVTVKEKRQQALWLVSHFVMSVQNAIIRKAFDPSVRAFYGLPLTSGRVPPLKSEDSIIYWGEQIANGEAARVLAGGVPVTFPSIAEVSAAVAAFKSANLNQANAKDAFDTAQEAVAAHRDEAKKLVLKIWNEIEAAFDAGDKPSKRRKCREWGVVYVPIKGEAPEAEVVL